MWSWYRGVKVEATGTILLYHLDPVVQGQTVTKEWLELNLGYLSKYLDYAFDKIYLLCTDKTQQQFAEEMAVYHTRIFCDARFPGGETNRVFKGEIKVVLEETLSKLFKRAELCDPHYTYLYWSSRVAYFKTKHDNVMEFFKGMIKADPNRLVVPSQYGAGLTDRLMLNEPELIKDVESVERLRARGKLGEEDHYYLHREFFQRLLATPKLEMPEKTIKSETFRHQLCPAVMIYGGDVISKVAVETDDNEAFYYKLGNMHLTMTLCSVAARLFVADPFVEQAYQRVRKPVTRNNLLTYLRLLNTNFGVTQAKEEVLSGSMFLQLGKIETTVNQSETKKLVEALNKYYAGLSEQSTINWLAFDSENMLAKLTEFKIDGRVRLVPGLSETHIQTIFSCFKANKFDGLIFNDATIDQVNQPLKLALVKVGTRVILVSREPLMKKVSPVDLDIIRLFYKEACNMGFALQPVEVTDNRIVFSLINYKENPGSSDSF